MAIRRRGRHPILRIFGNAYGVLCSVRNLGPTTAASPKSVATFDGGVATNEPFYVLLYY
jgi:hypothetical protein